MCLDLERREVISTQCMESITLVNTVNIVREALKSCRNEKPLLIVDHAPWYLSAYDWLKNEIDMLQKTFGIRNYIERCGTARSKRGQDDSTTTFPSKIKRRESREYPNSCIYSHTGITTCVLMKRSKERCHRRYLDGTTLSKSTS